MSEMVWMLIENDGAVLLAQRKQESRPSPARWMLPGDGPSRRASLLPRPCRASRRDDFGVQRCRQEFVETLTCQAVDS